MSEDIAQRLLEADRLTKYAILTDNPWIYEGIFDLFEEEAKQLRGFYGVRGVVGKYKDLDIALIGYGVGSSELMMVLEELFRSGVRIVVKIGYGLYIMTERPPARVAVGAIRFDKTSEGLLPLEMPALASFDLVGQVIHAFTDEEIPYEADLVLSTGYPYPHLEEDHFPSWWRRLGVNVIDTDTATLYIAAYYRRMKAASVIIPVMSSSEILERGSWITYKPSPKEASEHEHLLSAVLEAIYHSKEKALLDQKEKMIRKRSL